VETVEDQPREQGRDTALVARFQRGDAAAFNDIVREHRREIYLVARRILGSHEDADEAAQEAFVRAWHGLDRFRGDAALRTWLIRIVLNVARSMRRGPERSVSLDDAVEPSDPGRSAEQLAGRAELGKRLREAVAKLSPRQREVVALKVFSAMTYREVARVMDLSEGAVKAHLHQAVSNLRRRMT
jgi:RNA polymerase sigma-70 factor (ECF subfamily)